PPHPPWESSSSSLRKLPISSPTPPAASKTFSSARPASACRPPLPPPAPPLPSSPACPSAPLRRRPMATALSPPSAPTATPSPSSPPPTTSSPTTPTTSPTSSSPSPPFRGSELQLRHHWPQ